VGAALDESHQFRYTQLRMKTRFILVDFENVRPASLSVLRGTDFKIIVFLGAAQTRVPADLVVEMQALGPNAEYVRCSASGSNALDFHIAYYVGRLAVEHPGATFQIISGDKGFDPLIRHLKGSNISCERRASLDPQPATRKAAAPAPAPRPVAKPATKPKPGPPISVLDKVKDNLARRGNSRPRTVKTLHSTVRQIAGPDAPDAVVEKLVKDLVTQGVLSISDKTVTYPGS
jgi:hypothetical protein